ncbi:uncharacterized protein LOC127006592 isoform X2 [Eriocheir sinensis]|uniref:uncharacterized protein LOC127006592 isoform X2 n=1 Tax=Eriocheir sinensis TaxID=95602 RepID=UPI0021C7B8ED|nr:uncharacterized protein LOC127006592 isoform X2 [Eriocheir sinensis]
MKGMTTAQACRFHEEKLDLNLTLMANNAINPSRRAVAHLRGVWLSENLGSVDSTAMFTALRKYAQETDSRIEMVTEGEKIVVVLVTEFMLRIHKELREASEVVLVDTRSHVDQLNMAVTPFMCNGPAGPVPLGIVFTSSQEEASYTAGFRLLKRILGETAFFGQGQPDVFITDNSDAERKALKEVWPDSCLYLCIFHVLQQVWRWLCDRRHGIKKEDRPKLITVAKKLVYSESQEEFDNTWEEFIGNFNGQQYQSYTRYLSKLIERQEEWSIIHRQGKLPHRHLPNINAESTMCIIKDIILNRCKAFNTSQLVLYFNELFDQYMQQRLLDAALGRKPVKSAIAKTTEVDVQELGGLKFLVQSESTPGQTYTVDMQTGICDCISGQTSKPCKHKVTCADRCMLNLPQVFQSTPENRQWLAGVALGKEKVPSSAFFAELVPPTQNTELVISNPSPVQTENAVVLPQQDEKDKNVVWIIEEHTGPINTEEFTSNFLPLLEKFKDANTQANLNHLTKQLNLIKSSNQLNSFLSCAASAVTGSSRGCGQEKNPCQPTTIARQETGIPGGVAPLGKGRKRQRSEGEGSKRPQNLACNVSQIQGGAKTH